MLGRRFICPIGPATEREFILDWRISSPLDSWKARLVWSPLLKVIFNRQFGYKRVHCKIILQTKVVYFEVSTLFFLFADMSQISLDHILWSWMTVWHSHDMSIAIWLYVPITPLARYLYRYQKYSKIWDLSPTFDIKLLLIVWARAWTLWQLCFAYPQKIWTDFKKSSSNYKQDLF